MVDSRWSGDRMRCQMAKMIDRGNMTPSGDEAAEIGQRRGGGLCKRTTGMRCKDVDKWAGMQRGGCGGGARRDGGGGVAEAAAPTQQEWWLGGGGTSTAGLQLRRGVGDLRQPRRCTPDKICARSRESRAPQALHMRRRAATPPPSPVSPVDSDEEERDGRWLAVIVLRPCQSRERHRVPKLSGLVVHAKPLGVFIKQLLGATF